MVNGDVTGETTGISVEIASGDSASSIVVEGTVSGGNAITLNIGDDVDTGTVINAIPEIIVQALDSDADLVAVVGADADAETLTQQVLDKVRYIVDTEVDKSALTENLTVEIYRLDENGQRADLDTEGVPGKELTVASTGMKLIIEATSGSLAGVVVDTDNPNNTVTYNEAAGTYEIIVGIGGGLKFTATPKKPEPEPQPQPELKPEPVPAQQTAAVPSSYAETKPVNEQQTALVTLDYRNHLLIIDMTKTAVQTFLADTLRRFHMYNGFDIAIIKVANGSFTVDMADLLELLGHAPSLTLKVSGDTLAILVDGAEVAMLVMA